MIICWKKIFTQIFFYIQQTFVTCFTKEPSAASGHVIQAAHTAKYRSEKFFLFVFFKNSTVFLLYIWNRTKTKFDMHWISKCGHSFWLAAIFVLCQSTLMHELQKCVLNFSEGIKKPALITEQRKACKAGGSVSVSFKVLKASFYCHKNLALKSETKGVPPQWSMNVLSKPPTVPHTIFLLHKKQKQKDPNCFLMVAPVESLYQHCNWSFLKRDLKMLGCMLLMQSFELCEAVRLQVC